MNKTIVSGYLANNPNVNYNGKVGFMTIAVKRPYPYNLNQNGEKVTDFLTLKFIGEHKVDFARKYLSKGMRILVEGSTCRDKDQSQDKEYNFIIVDNCQFMQKKSENTKKLQESNYENYNQEIESNNNLYTPENNGCNNSLVRSEFIPISESEYNDLPF